MQMDPVWENIKRFDVRIHGLKKYKYPGTAADHLYRAEYLTPESEALLRTMSLRPKITRVEGLPCWFQ